MQSNQLPDYCMPMHSVLDARVLNILVKQMANIPQCHKMMKLVNHILLDTNFLKFSISTPYHSKKQTISHGKDEKWYQKMCFFFPSITIQCGFQELQYPNAKQNA